jgi:mono/diheme cytochrome c family protein
MYRIAFLSFTFFACASADKDGLQETGDAHLASGKSLYGTYCSACHGETGNGSDQGPSLEEEVVENSEEDIVNVILNGDDDMEPVDVSEKEAAIIAAYVKNDLF